MISDNDSFLFRRSGVCRPHRKGTIALRCLEKAKEQSVSCSHTFFPHVFLFPSCINIKRQGLAAKVIDCILGWQSPCFPPIAQPVLPPFSRNEMVMRVPHFLPGLLPICKQNVKVLVAS